MSRPAPPGGLTENSNVWHDVWWPRSRADVIIMEEAATFTPSMLEELRMYELQYEREVNAIKNRRYLARILNQPVDICFSIIEFLKPQSRKKWIESRSKMQEWHSEYHKWMQSLYRQSCLDLEHELHEYFGRPIYFQIGTALNNAAPGQPVDILMWSRNRH